MSVSRQRRVTDADKTVLDVLFPAVRAELLRLLFEPPQKHRYVRELMARSGLALHTVQDELRKLAAIKLIVSWSNGYHRFYHANTRHPLFKPLLSIVQLNQRLTKTKRSDLRRPVSGKTKRRRKHPIRWIPPEKPIPWHIIRGPH